MAMPGTCTGQEATMRFMVCLVSLQMPLAPGCDHGGASLQRQSVFRFPHGHRRQAVEPLREACRDQRWHVLGQGDRRTVRRQGGYHMGQGFDAAGGRSKRDQPHRACTSTKLRWNDRHRRGTGPELLASPRGGGTDDPGQGVECSRTVGRRLGHAIDRARFQSLHGGYSTACRHGENHHHRHRAQAHDAFQKVQAIHARHFDVQRHRIGVERLHSSPGRPGIACLADDDKTGIARQGTADQCAHRRRVVHHQDAGHGHVAASSLRRYWVTPAAWNNRVAGPLRRSEWPMNRCPPAGMTRARRVHRRSWVGVSK